MIIGTQSKKMSTDQEGSRKKGEERQPDRKADTE